MKILAQYSKPTQYILYLLILCTPHIYASNNDKPKELKSTELQLKHNKNKIFASIEFDQKNSNQLTISTIEKNNQFKRNIYNIKTKEEASSQKEIQLEITKSKTYIKNKTVYIDAIVNRVAQNNNVIVPYKSGLHHNNLFVYPKEKNQSIKKTRKIKQKQNIRGGVAIHPKENIIAYFQQIYHLGKDKPKLTICFIKKKKTKEQSFTLLDSNGDPLDQSMSLCFDPNKPWIAAWNTSHLFFFNYKNKTKEKKSITHLISNAGLDHIFDICFAKKNKYDLIVGAVNGILTFNSTDLNKEPKKYTTSQITRRLFHIKSIDLNHDESLLAAVSHDEQIEAFFWDLESGKPLYHYKAKDYDHSSFIGDFITSFNADDTKFAIFKINDRYSNKTALKLLTLPKRKVESLKRLAAFVIGKNNIDTSNIPKLLLQGTCLE